MWQPLRLWLSGSYDVVRTIEKYGIYTPKKNSFTLEIKRKDVLHETQRRFFEGQISSGHGQGFPVFLNDGRCAPELRRNSPRLAESDFTTSG